MNDTLPTCVTLADCATHEGQRVHIIGTYTVWDPLPVRHANQPPARQVIVALTTDPEPDGPFLEAWGFADHMRPLDEIARFRGQKVRVTGTFLGRMPPAPNAHPDAAALDGPTIHPIESIELAR